LLLLCLVVQIITGITLAMEKKLCSYKILQIAGTPLVRAISRKATNKIVESSETKGKTCVFFLFWPLIRLLSIIIPSLAMQGKSEIIESLYSNP